MSIPFVPYAFKAGDNLDLEKLNDALESISRNTQRSLDARYTYSEIRLDLTGLVTASATVLRQLPIRRHTANGAVEVYAVEVELYGNSAGTATVVCSDTTWPTLSVTTTDVTTAEAYGSSGVPVSIPSTDVTFTVVFPAAYTVTNGYMIVHLRCDRGNQGTSHAGYFPALLTSSTSAPGTTLDAELTSLAAAVARDTASSTDLRGEGYTVRGLAAGASVTWRVPGGLRTGIAARYYLVAANTETVTVTVGTASNSLGGTGVASVVSRALSFTDTEADLPMDPAEDTTITISNAGIATALLVYLQVWWR